MNKEEMICYLIDYLLKEVNKEIDYADLDKFLIFRSLINVREPKEVDLKFIDIQNEYLKLIINEKGVIDYKKFHVKDNIYLVQGDITLINADVIVNAANKYLLGCFIPNHKCIDNAIHTFAGVQLRNLCNNIMRGDTEGTGLARITESFNLPCKKIIHTVGPIVSKLNQQDKEDLRSCYKNCIELAIENKMKSIALCCISTGEFCFPNYDAAIIALDVIKNYKNIDIVINVFKDVDYEIYKKLLCN